MSPIPTSEGQQMYVDPMTAKLRQALGVARDNRTALVVVPNVAILRQCLNTLVQQLADNERWKASYTAHSLHYGERGSVRLYTMEQHEWDASTQRLRGYPHDVPVFVIEPAPVKQPKENEHGEA